MNKGLKMAVRRVTVSLPTKTVDKLKDISKREDRTVSNMVAIATRQYINKWEERNEGHNK